MARSRKELGEIAYNAYCKNVGGKSMGGDDLLVWDMQFPQIRKAWEAAAKAVLEAIRKDAEIQEG